MENKQGFNSAPPNVQFLNGSTVVLGYGKDEAGTSSAPAVADPRMAWLGRQIALVKQGKREEAEGNAKLMAPLFVGPDEEEVIKFFIKDGGGGSGGNGGGSQNPPPPGGSDGKPDAEPQAQPQSQPEKPEGESQGEVPSGSSTGEGGVPPPVKPDGEYLVHVESDIAGVFPPDSQHRLYLRGPKRGEKMSDAELFKELSSAYGSPFKVKKFGGQCSVNLAK